MLSPLHRRRVLALADFIETSVEAEHFAMDSWFQNHHTGQGIYIASEREMAENFSTDELPRLKAEGRWFTSAKEAAKSCGTAACIAGWCALQHPRAVDASHDRVMISAGEYLGLTNYQAQRLFTPSGLTYCPGPDEADDDLDERFVRAREHFSKDNAVKALRELAETGEVPKSWEFEVPKGWEFEVPKGWEFEVPKSWEPEVPKSWEFEVYPTWARSRSTSSAIATKAGTTISTRKTKP